MSDLECLNMKINTIESKLEEHHSTLENHTRRLSDFSDSLHENTSLTKQIADNTGEMVELFKEAKIIIKWGSVFKRFVLWTGSVAVSAAAIYAALELWIKK